MFKSIKYKLGAILGCFVIFMFGAILATFWSVNSQKSEGLIINLAGKQRMLSQKMSKEALTVSQGKENGETLLKTMNLFDKTLKGLISGDADLGLSPTHDPKIVSQLNSVLSLWNDFRESLDTVVKNSGARNQALDYISENNLSLLKQMNAAVVMMEEAGLSAKHINLTGRQRMLTQKITKEALLLSEGAKSNAVLLETTNLLDQTHKGLLNGDTNMGLNRVSNAGIRSKLEEIGVLWDKFRGNVINVAEKSGKINKALSYEHANNLNLLKEMNKAVKLFEEDSESKISNLKMILDIFLILAVLLSIIGFVLINRLVALPIRKVVEILKDIATGEGDLTKRINITSNDEIGELANWFNTFVEKIHDIVAQISQTALNVGSAAEEMASSIQQASATSSEISKGAETQSAAVTESTSSISEMGKAIKNVAENSVAASDIASKANNEADKGGEAVEQTVTAMKNIEESSKKIEVIVGVITDIANQTNLLALNAAIEAAKAGEQGKGFAVVAEEVRKLAERSGESTKEIKSLIDESTERVANGTKVAKDAGNALNEIIGGVRKTTGLVEQISSAAEEQSAGADQVTKAIEELAKISEQNASSTEELSASTRELANAADELSGMADDLNQIVNQFKVDHGKIKSTAGKVKQGVTGKKRLTSKGLKQLGYKREQDQEEAAKEDKVAAHF